ncbi:DUF6197 family protein (plasmid) [Streptomyces sp. GDS52]|uniref:DUF6197 family protein n=1 Tax=Streptomyces sp. GDS52 TaxID=3406419 RepID=UPI003FD5ACD1
MTTALRGRTHHPRQEASMNATDLILRETARIIDFRGLHTGSQFATNTGRRSSLEAPLDICAAVYAAATGQVPDVFYTDEIASLTLIESSEPAMAAIRAISAALGSDVCETNGVPDYIEHVSNWTATRAPFDIAPPTTGEVIDRIHRAADLAARPQTDAA